MLLALITNDAIEPADYAVIKVFIDAGLSIISAGELEKREGLALSVADISHSVTMLSMNWGIPGKLPIFNDARFTLPNSPILLKVANNEPMKEKVYLLGYEIKSPRMPMKQAFTVLTRINDIISISGQYLNGEELSANYHELGF